MNIDYTVSAHGAELQSLRFDGREYLWQGDPAYWGRRAPILFPIVGKVAGDVLRVDGQSYPMKQHGFARDVEFVPDAELADVSGRPVPGHAEAVPELVDAVSELADAVSGLAEVVPGLADAVPELVEGPTDCRFVMAGDGTRENYPFKYGFSVRYHVDGKRLYCTWTVENRDERDLHFQIGAHPAFNLPDFDPSDPVHGYIECHDADGRLVDPVLRHYLVDGLRVPFEEPCRMLRQAQHPEDRSLSPLTLPEGRSLSPSTPLEGRSLSPSKGRSDSRSLSPSTPSERSLSLLKGRLALANDTFAADAFLIEGAQVASATLIDKAGRPVLTVGCPQAQAFGLWAPSKPGCPFVCLEPWCGITDPAGFAGDISERELDHRLAPGERYEFTYWIEVAGN